MTEGFGSGFFVWLVLSCFGLLIAPSYQVEVNFFEDLNFSSPDVKLLFKRRIHSCSFYVSSIHSWE